MTNDESHTEAPAIYSVVGVVALQTDAKMRQKLSQKESYYDTFGNFVSWGEGAHLF